MISSDQQKYIFWVDEKEFKPCKPINVCLAHRTKPCDKCNKYQGKTILFYQKIDDNANDLNFPKHTSIK